MNQLNEQDRGQMVWYGWFAIVCGVSVAYLVLPLWGSAGAIGNVAVTVAIVGSVIAVCRGWLYLSIEAKIKNGINPKWGVFQVLPWVFAVVFASVISTILIYIAWWAGSQFESFVISSVPSEIVWRTWFSKLGYVSFLGIVLWHIPRIFKQVSQQIKSYKDVANA